MFNVFCWLLALKMCTFTSIDFEAEMSIQTLTASSLTAAL